MKRPKRCTSRRLKDVHVVRSQVSSAMILFHRNTHDRIAIRKQSNISSFQTSNVQHEYFEHSIQYRLCAAKVGWRHEVAGGSTEVWRVGAPTARSTNGTEIEADCPSSKRGPFGGVNRAITRASTSYQH